VTTTGSLVFALALVSLLPAGAAAAQLASREDATISSTENGWSVSNAYITYAVGFDANGDLVVQDLRRTGDSRSWRPGPVRDTLFRIGDREVGLARNDASAFRHVGVATPESGTGLELRLVFENLRDGVRATRVYKILPQVAILEIWTELESMLGRSNAVSDMVSLQITVDGALATTVDGLNAPAETGGSFAVHHKVISDDEALILEELGRSSARHLPLVSVASARGTLVTGLMWSGAWRMDLVGRSGDRTEITAWQSRTTTAVAPGRSVAMPHAILGVVEGDEAAIAPALHRFVVVGLRGGRSLEPLATYNTWFSTGTRIDQDLIEKEIDAAAAAGAELFELDAGWYEGAGELHDFDFSSGLGTYRVDRDKFPDGLRRLADRAHALGMKFGVWVEPERVDLRYVGDPGMAREAWLQLENGRYEAGVPNEEARTGMLDLGNPEARAWVLEKLSTLIHESGADHLKWDNNAWITNTRPLTGAGASDGNFRHIVGLYELLAALRERFPWLLIENCAGGGNRLDLGLMRYTDAAWMDDRTSPSAHVRHNLQGLTTFFPPAYLLSYLLHDATEPMHEAADFALYARSRMPGVFGMSFPPDSLDERDMERLREATDRWKDLRHVQASASAVSVGPQVLGPESGPWDATLLVSPAADSAVLYAFQNDGEVPGVRLRLRGLDRTFQYLAASDREGELGVFSGGTLMDDGLEVFGAETTGAHLITLTRLSPEDAETLRLKLSLR
jgi:alpha-galactosidase